MNSKISEQKLIYTCTHSQNMMYDDPRPLAMEETKLAPNQTPHDGNFVFFTFTKLTLIMKIDTRIDDWPT